MFSRKQNVSQDNVFLFETLHTTPWRHICLIQAVIFSSTDTLFAAIAALSNNMRLQIKNVTNIHVFYLGHSL